VCPGDTKNPYACRIQGKKTRSIVRRRRRRMRMGGDRDDGIAASIAINVRFGRVRSIGRSVGRSTATAATFGGARARWSGN